MLAAAAAVEELAVLLWLVEEVPALRGETPARAAAAAAAEEEEEAEEAAGGARGRWRTPSTPAAERTLRLSSLPC